MLAVIAALAVASDTPVLNADGLSRYIKAARANPSAAAPPARFRLEFEPVSNRKTDLRSLQTPVGYSYDRKSGAIAIDVDFGAVAPGNFSDFDKLGLQEAPPLRTVFFDTTSARDTTYHIVSDGTGGGAAAQGWRVTATSYGLAVATSAKAYGTRGGDLPDDFILPFVMHMRAPGGATAPQAVRGLRVRIEGELRTIGGRSVLCSRSGGDGYVVDEITQRTPNVIMDRQCLAPAVITRVSLVRTAGGPPLKTWVRSSDQPTEETMASAVIMAGTRNREAPSLLQEPNATSPSATAPLPKRP